MTAQSPDKNSILAYPWKAIAFVLIMLVAVDLAKNVFESILQAAYFLDTPNIEHISMFLATAGVSSVALLIWRNIRGPGGVLSKGSGYWIITGVLAGIAFFCVFLILTNVSLGSYRERYFEELARFSRDLNSFPFYTSAMMLITSGILIPVLEETLFRGVIFRSLKEKYGIHIGVAGSATLFAGTHVGSDIPFVLVYMLLFGASSSLFVHFSGKLVSSYSMHITYNVLISVYSFLHGSAISAKSFG